MDIQNSVKEFHEKNGYPVGLILHPRSGSTWLHNILLRLLSSSLLFVTRKLQNRASLYQKLGDPRLYRMCLILEEAGEIGLGLSKFNEVDVADGLADLMYVTAGTAVSYDIPLAECFCEVHRANMSKKKRNENCDPRMRDKGNWTPPDIASAIRDGRCRLFFDEEKAV